MEQEELQTKYYEFQLLNEQLKERQQQTQLLEEQLVELQAALQTIDELDENKEILLPISGGIFARAKLTTSNELMVNVGANVIVKKKNNETKELLDKRVVQVQEFHEQMTTGIQQLTAKLQVIATELQGQVDSQNV